MKKGFDVKGTIIRTITVLAILTISFGLAGCGEEMTKMEEHQIELQTMVDTNTQQIASLGKRIEQNQQQLSAGLVEMQDDIRTVAANTAAVSQEQMKLQKATQNSNRQTTTKIAQLEQSQNEMQTGIEEVRNNTQNVAADMGTDIANVKEEQARLYETVQSNSQQFTNNLAVIEQNQRQWEGKITELQENIQQVTTQISTLGNNLSKLQEVLQSNIQEMVSMMNTSDKEQLKFREKIQQNLLAVDSSIKVIKQTQEQLQNQIENVRSTAETMSTELPAAIEQLREEVKRNTTSIEESQPSPEANNTE